MRTPLVITVAILGSVLLASCAATPEADPTSGSSSTPSRTGTASVTPTPTASPEAPAEQIAAPAGIIIGALATDIVDASGTVLLSLDYDTDGDEAVAQLTELIGEPTATENRPKAPHFFETDAAIWDGFEIGVLRPDEGITTPSRFTVQAKAASAAGLTIAAVDGTEVGGSFEAAQEGLPVDQTYSDPNYPPRALALELDPAMAADNVAYGLIATESESGGTIAMINAPDYVYDAA
ncbi:MAG: hypothetical protein JWQ43_2511 [Glaciihabitans sp.]|nr:hypothetical protein [Glaciihabitans sp.]